MKRTNKSVIEGGNPKLLQFLVRDGKDWSLSLEYNLGVDKQTGKYNRRREGLKLYGKVTPRTPEERQHNKDIIELARRIRWEREQELMENREGYRLRKDRRIPFLTLYQIYIDGYTKKDIRMIKIARERFKDFLSSNYKLPADAFMPDALTHDMMMRFVDYLQSRSVGEGAKSIWQRFKKVVRSLIDQGYLKCDPCKGVACVVDDQVLKKDILSLEEIQQLIATHYKMENPEIRKAFIFCLYTGMRWCDVKDLKYGNIDFSNKLLTFEQDKTKGHSSRSWVTIPLNDGLLKLIGQPPFGKSRNAPVFQLSCYESALKAIKRWVKKAGIDKHISWHCARHSFAVNILNNGANIKTVSSLLGHSSLKHTEKYTRAVDKLKEEAINSLPELKF